VKLSEIAELNPGLGNALGPDDPISFLAMASVFADTGSTSLGEERRYLHVRSGYTPFLDGDLLVAKITPCFENGKIAQANLRHRFGFGSTEFHVVRPHPNRANARYLLHFLRQDRVRRAGEKRMTGSAGQRRVPAEFLADLEVPVPPLPEQQRIADVLDRAEALRAKRRAALAKLDTLTRSTFLGMFGDPRDNPKGFPVRALAEFYVNPVDGTKCGPFGSALKKSELVPEGIPVWNMDNIDPSGRMVLPFRMWIPERKYRQLDAYAVADGDVIVSRAGTVGKMCVVAITGTRSIISTNLIRLRLGPDLLPLFFVSLMTHCKGRVGRLKTGPDGAFTHMNTGTLDGLSFPYPPMDLQIRFGEITESIEKQRRSLTVQLEELDTLFASLQQRAFAGEL
jgi:type I restriction enzyme S subunit